VLEIWQSIRARHPEIPPVVIIIADARWVRFDPQRWTIHTTGTLAKILLVQTTGLALVRESPWLPVN
jgi:hypothetical protein